MASQPASLHSYTYREYLAHDEASSTKHEYFRKEIYAMAGGTPLHAALSSAVGAALSAEVEGSPRRTYSSDLRVRVLASDLATYPDLTIVCGELETDPESAVTVTNPAVLVEVLSESTEAYDRGEKLEQYKSIASAHTIVIVAQSERLIEVWSRSGEGIWSRTEAREGETAELPRLPGSLDVQRLYDAAGAPSASAG